MLPPFCRYTVGGGVFRPLDIILTGDNTLAIIVRHVAQGNLLVIPKYKFPVGGRAQSPWRLAGIELRRLLETYSPRSVWSSVRASGIRVVWSPIFSSKIPVTSVENVRLHCGVGPGELFEYASYLAAASSSILEVLEALFPLSSCLRLTGSLLHGSFVEGVSDVDLVVDVSDKKCMETLYDLTPELAKHSIPRETAESYIAREASRRNIDGRVVASIYRRWSRLRIGGVHVSLTIVDSVKRMEAPKFTLHTTNETVKTIATVEPLNYLLGDFPAIVETREGIALIVYDGIYIPALLEGGRFEVQGVKAEYIDGEEKREAIVVGVAEKPTYMRYLAHA